MRRLRLQTDVSHKNLEAALVSLKEKIEAILKESTEMLEQREKTLERKEELERQNILEQQQFEEEYEKMGKFIREQNALLEESLMHERRTDLIDEFKYQRGDLTIEEEDAMAGRVGALTNFVATEQSSLATIQIAIHDYETKFEQLKRITNTDSLEEVISTYAAHEEEMFSMYNYIQTQNTEIETIIEATQQIKDEIKMYKQRQQEQDDQRQKVLDGLRQRLHSTRAEASACDRMNKDYQDSVDQIAKKVQSLFFKLQCDQMDSTKGGSSSNKVGQKGQSVPRAESKIAILTGQTVSESNVLDFMGAIEQRAVDIIAEYLKVQNRQDGNRSPTPGPMSPMKWPASTIVELPEIGEDDLIVDGDETDSKPVDLSAFKDKLQRKILAASAKEFKGSMTY